MKEELGTTQTGRRVEPLPPQAAPAAHRRSPARASFTLFLAVVGTALGLMVVLLVIDLQISDVTTDNLLEGAQRHGLSAALGSLSEVLAAVLGLSLTVVAIVVQLAAQRYSPKIVDLFMRDPVNVGAFSFMVVSCIYVVLLPAFAAEEATPDVAVAAGLVLAVCNFGLLLPYFGHVFAFLQPDNIITQIEVGAKRSLIRANRGGDIAETQRHIAQAIERITDNCLAAINQSDRSLALHSIRTMERLLADYLRQKKELPEGWSSPSADYFLSLSQEFYAEIVAQGTWVEAKGLMEFEHVVRRALGPMSELASQIAASTRVVGEGALATDDDEALELVVRFFNTYIRHSLNKRDVRSVYNVLYQYRLFTGAVMHNRPELASRVVQHLVYYGRLANAMGLPFVTVTVAHDVRVLCERAFVAQSTDVLPLLELFLTLDQPSEGKSEELALLGVRKAQSILGAFFLYNSAERLADLIREDMHDEHTARLTEIRDSILMVRERKFWEITDRGFNFDYVEPHMHPEVRRFFAPLVQADRDESNREPVAADA